MHYLVCIHVSIKQCFIHTHKHVHIYLSLYPPARRATRRRSQESTGPLILLILLISWPTGPTDPDFLDLCGHVTPPIGSPYAPKTHHVCLPGGGVFPSWGFPDFLYILTRQRQNGRRRYQKSSLQAILSLTRHHV